jgi:hypothetical protein
MRYVKLLVVVASFVTMSAAGGSAVSGSAQPFQTRSASVFLRTDRSQYSLRETIVIDVGVRNDGREPIYVYNRMTWGMSGGLVLWLRDDKGQIIESVLRDDTIMEPPPPDDPSIFAKLRPGMFIGTRRKLEARLLVRRAGRYTIQVEYRAAVSRDYVHADQRALPALWRESSSIWSEKATLDIGR